jgi:hypothetical protein
MNRIPFQLNDVSGFLHICHPQRPPVLIHVMEHRQDGDYYCGQLLFTERYGWRLPDSKYERYAETLGNLVEVWWE